MSKKRMLYFVDLDSPHSSHFDEGWCYTEESIRQTMEDEDIDELRTYRAEREIGSDGFYCREHGEVGLKRDMLCGKNCSAYAPRNGKNGNCRHRRGVWQSTDEVVVFQRKEVING